MKGLAVFLSAFISTLTIIVFSIWALTGVNILDKQEPKSFRMMCVTQDHEKGGYIKTAVWDSHSMRVNEHGVIESPEGVYRPFPGELCLVAPITISRGPKP